MKKCEIIRDIPNIHRRDDLPEMERAVSDTLDEYLSRCYGIVATSWAHPYEFILWLEERGYKVVSVEIPA